MKLFEFLKAKEYVEKNPDAQDIPDEVMQEPEKEPESNKVTIDNLLKEFQILKSVIENNKKWEVPKQDEQTKSEIDELRNSIKELTTEMQQANQKTSDLPKEETSDDILKSFFTGGN